MTYTIKQLPEDFVVDEIAELPKDGKGKYAYFLLLKKNLTTEEAVQKLAAITKKPRRHFSYAGNKDKRAVTRQLCSVLGSIRDFKQGNLEVVAAGRGKEPLYLGCHQGNRFRITVRNLDSSDLEAFNRNYREFKGNDFRFANCFDSQRFSSNNAEIGKAIIKKDFRAAARTAAEKEVEEHLRQSPNDYVGALKRLPQKTLQLYVHAYQSRLWNELASHSSGSKNVKIPLIGFATRISGESKQLLEKEGISPRDFIIRQLPVSAEGGERSLYAFAKELRVEAIGDDDLNRGKSKVKLSFFLEKGSYATVVVKELLKKEKNA